MRLITRFMLGIGIGFLASACTYFLLFRLGLGAPIPGTGFNAAVIRLKKEQAMAVKSPKLLLIGGSSVGNGLSAKTIEERLGVPCYNYSFWASLGAEYFMDQAKSVLHPGDCVLLCLEYEVLDWNGPNGLWLNPEFLRFVMATDPGLIRKKSLLEQVQMAFSLPPTVLFSDLMSWKKGPETISDTIIVTERNRWGDAINNVKKKRTFDDSSRTASSQIFISGFKTSPKGFTSIKEFSGWAESHGIKIVATFPNLARNTAYTSERLLAVENIIRANYREIGIPVVGSLQSAMFNTDDYFDTNYHLTYEGAVKRTELLLPDLKETLVGWATVK